MGVGIYSDIMVNYFFVNGDLSLMLNNLFCGRRVIDGGENEFFLFCGAMVLLLFQ